MAKKVEFIPENKDEIKKVVILGEEWTIKFCDEDPGFEEAQGYEEYNERKIVIENVKVDLNDPLGANLHTAKLNQKRVIRHEILHAFLDESGLGNSSHTAEAWATNEEMVDWFAMQSPKIFKVYKELGVL